MTHWYWNAPIICHKSHIFSIGKCSKICCRRWVPESCKSHWTTWTSMVDWLIKSSQVKIFLFKTYTFISNILERLKPGGAYLSLHHGLSDTYMRQWIIEHHEFRWRFVACRAICIIWTKFSSGPLDPWENLKWNFNYKQQFYARQWAWQWRWQVFQFGSVPKR